MNRSQLLLISTFMVLTTACRTQSSSLASSSAGAATVTVAPKITATLQNQSSWQGGYCANLVLNNTGTTAVSTWTVVLQLNGAQLNQSWNLQQQTTGKQITLKPTATWNATLAPGATSTNQGFCANLASGAQAATVVSAVANATAATVATGAAGGTTSLPSTYPQCTNGSNTGNGYGWDTSVIDPNGSHSCLVAGNGSGSSSGGSTGSANTAGAGSALPALNVAAAANSSFSIHDYGSALQVNKAALSAAADAAGASAQEKAVVIAMAMQETTLMDPVQRDGHKDGTSSANCSILNLNIDMLTKVGYTVGDNGASLNNPANLSQAVGYLLTAFRTWGIQSTLNYQRGGSTAFADGSSYGVGQYRSAIATIYAQIAADLSLETDGRRVEINVQGV